MAPLSVGSLVNQRQALRSPRPGHPGHRLARESSLPDVEQNEQNNPNEQYANQLSQRHCRDARHSNLCSTHHTAVVPFIKKEPAVPVLLGFAMIAVFMVLIMTKKLTPVLALIIVPTVFGLFAGAGLGIGDMVMDSMKSMPSTAALLMIAIIYFGLMIDVG